MDLQNEKCVMVIDEKLPLGIIANTAAMPFHLFMTWVLIWKR